MKLIRKLLATLFCAALVPVAFAQHSGHGGTSSGGGFGNTGNDSAMRDLQRAMMLSATDDQRMAFAKCMEATDRVLRLADQIVGQGTGLNYDAAVLSERKEQLQAALAELGTVHQHFRHSLSQPQEKELRKYLGKLERVQTELSKRIAQVDRELSASKPDSKRLRDDTHKVKEVAEKWQSEHRKIAKEMGIAG
jgi:chromosome segregation ATPase